MKKIDSFLKIIILGVIAIALYFYFLKSKKKAIISNAQKDVLNHIKQETKINPVVAKVEQDSATFQEKIKPTANVLIKEEPKIGQDDVALMAKYYGKQITDINKVSKTL